MLLINYITPQLQFMLQYNTEINSTIQYYVSIGHIWQQILDIIALISQVRYLSRSRIFHESFNFSIGCFVEANH